MSLFFDSAQARLLLKLPVADAAAVADAATAAEAVRGRITGFRARV